MTSGDKISENKVLKDNTPENTTLEDETSADKVLKNKVLEEKILKNKASQSSVSENATAYFQKISADLLAFIEESPSPFHVVANTAAILEKDGFVRLSETEKWEIVPGGKYYVTRNFSSLIAFTVLGQDFNGFRLICSHTDSPVFKMKENPEMGSDGKYTKLNVEKYGGMLCAPWFDRPLSVAGRIMVQTEKGIEMRLVNLNRDLLMIPNLAIHMNREVNDGYKYNVQTDLCPVFGDENAKGSFLTLVAEAAGVEEKQILGTDLFLYNRQKGTFWGAEEEFIASPRLDDLQCLYGSLRGFLEALRQVHAGTEKAECEQNPDCSSIPVFCAFDNEETGSVSRQGAASTLLHDVLVRINSALGRSQEEYLRAVASSFLISADNAHAVHPNHPEKADPVNRPQMNQGIVIKYNANQKYTTDARSASVLRLLCQEADIPCQTFTNRSDMAGGSTLGNISNTQVSLQSVDIGLPQLAMHSPYEMAGKKDVYYMKELARIFYSTKLKITDEQICLK